MLMRNICRGERKTRRSSWRLRNQLIAAIRGPLSCICRCCLNEAIAYTMCESGQDEPCRCFSEYERVSYHILRMAKWLVNGMVDGRSQIGTIRGDLSVGRSRKE